MHTFLGIRATLCCRNLITVLLLFLPVVAISASTGSGEYDIPLSELQRGKQESTAPKMAPERPKAKKTKTSRRKNRPVTPVASEQDNQKETSEVPAGIRNLSAKSSLVKKTAEGTGRPKEKEAGAGGAVTPESIRIIHEPYSFIVPGKRTLIQAVVSSEAVINSVTCRFRTLAGGGYARVKMTKTADSRFTYEALLPGVASGGRALNYSFTVVDAAGKEGKSQEYSIVVSDVPFTPGWQLENSSAAISFDAENKTEPLQWFSDPAVSR